jgi:hypothetical protein
MVLQPAILELIEHQPSVAPIWGGITATDLRIKLTEKDRSIRDLEDQLALVMSAQ